MKRNKKNIQKRKLYEELEITNGKSNERKKKGRTDQYPEKFGK